MVVVLEKGGHENVAPFYYKSSVKYTGIAKNDSFIPVYSSNYGSGTKIQACTNREGLIYLRHKPSAVRCNPNMNRYLYLYMENVALFISLEKFKKNYFREWFDFPTRVRVRVRVP